MPSSSTRPAMRRGSISFAASVRWLHIYVSLLSFTALVFFGVTGITLNHPDWFAADSQRVVEHEGKLQPEWLKIQSETDSSVAKLEIVEYLRTTHGFRGAVAEFRVDPQECLVLFKGPGYSADVIIDCQASTYRATETMMGLVAVLNDFHKGRDTGPAWSVLIDLVSLLTVFVSVTGLILILYIRRKRITGIVTTLVGTLIVLVVAIWLVH